MGLSGVSLMKRLNDEDYVDARLALAIVLVWIFIMGVTTWRSLNG